MRNDAVESAVRCRSGSRIARPLRAPVFSCARGVRERAICELFRRRAVDSIASLRSVCKMLRNDAGESA
eukprot:8380857-Lingulodinium_polyedra.AAC.1